MKTIIFFTLILSIVASSYQSDFFMEKVVAPEPLPLNKLQTTFPFIYQCANCQKADNCDTACNLKEDCFSICNAVLKYKYNMNDMCNRICLFNADPSYFKFS